MIWSVIIVFCHLEQIMWWKQWKECAVLFMNKISNESKTVKLVMVENYLAETHGTVKELTDYENKK